MEKALPTNKSWEIGSLEVEVLTRTVRDAEPSLTGLISVQSGSPNCRYGVFQTSDPPFTDW